MGLFFQLLLYTVIISYVLKKLREYAYNRHRDNAFGMFVEEVLG